MWKLGDCNRSGFNARESRHVIALVLRDDTHAASDPNEYEFEATEATKSKLG